ncbi:MAG: hypothetical protein NUV53_04150 [Patescibacteria group bacterium]|nr:hypothetical protein [Patescibacteria group bacterium]
MKQYLFFLIIVGVVGLIAIVIRGGYYPIALVGNTVLFAKEFKTHYRVAETYYRNAAASYGVTSTVPFAQLERMAMASLIEGALIHTEIQEEIENNVDVLVKDRIDKFMSDTELLQAAKVLYGTSAEELRDVILVPQAEREILTGNLFLRGERLDDWLVSAKKEKRIVIFVGGFGDVEIHEEGAGVPVQ